MPRVAVITPTYNRGDNGLLEKAMLSVLGQSYRDFVHVIVDDGSADSTPDIVDKYASDKRVAYIRREKSPGQKLGASPARNYAIDRLDNFDAEFITFLDSDDLYPCNCIERKIDTADSLGVKMVYSWLGAFGEEGPAWATKGLNEADPASMARHLKSRLKPDFPHLTVFLTAGLLGEVGKYDENLAFGEDRDFSVRVMERLVEGEMAVVPEILYYYRIHGDGVCAYYNMTREVRDEIAYFHRKHGRTATCAVKQFIRRPHSFLPEDLKRMLRPVRDGMAARFSEFDLEPLAKRIESGQKAF